jgi:hypothetical protein
MAVKTKRPDYVEPGSARHAALLGLREATDDDEIQYDGWALQDVNLLGIAATDRAIREVLRQKVTSLTSKTPVIQSDDPTAPGYAPPIWMPDDE